MKPIFKKLGWNLYREQKKWMFAFFLVIFLSFVIFLIVGSKEQYPLLADFIYSIVQDRYTLMYIFLPVIIAFTLILKTYDLIDIFAGYGRKVIILETLFMLIIFNALFSMLFSIGVYIWANIFSFDFKFELVHLQIIGLAFIQVFITNMLTSVITLLCKQLLSSAVLPYLASFTLLFSQFSCALANIPNLIFNAPDLGSLAGWTFLSFKVMILLLLFYLYTEILLKKDWLK